MQFKTGRSDISRVQESDFRAHSTPKQVVTMMLSGKYVSVPIPQALQLGEMSRGTMLEYPRCGLSAPIVAGSPQRQAFVGHRIIRGGRGVQRWISKLTVVVASK